MSLPQDFKDLLSALAAKQVEYLLIGGYAVGFHGKPRFTKDIDLWIRDTPDNVARTFAALAEFGAPEHVLESLRTMAPDEVLFMGTIPIRVDILKTVSGADFTAAYPRRVEAVWDDVKVSIIGFDDLVASKRAAGRKQDLLDVEQLEKMHSRDAGGK